MLRESDGDRRVPEALFDGERVRPLIRLRPSGRRRGSRPCPREANASALRNQVPSRQHRITWPLPLVWPWRSETVLPRTPWFEMVSDPARRRSSARSSPGRPRTPPFGSAFKHTRASGSSAPPGGNCRIPTDEVRMRYGPATVPRIARLNGSVTGPRARRRSRDLRAAGNPRRRRPPPPQPDRGEPLRPRRAIYDLRRMELGLGWPTMPP